MIFRSCALAATIVVSLCSVGESFAQLTTAPSDGEVGEFYSVRDCGPVALALVCRLRHVSVSVDDLRRATLQGLKGTNAAELVKAAEGLGLKAVGVKCTAESLAEGNCLAIVGLEDHFAVFVGVHPETGKLLIVDVPEKPRYVTVGELEEQIGNPANAILFPRVEWHPSNAETDAPLAVKPSVRDVGEIWDGDVGRCSFAVTNPGTRDIKILDLRACCGSTARMNSKGLQPGQTTELEVEYKGQNTGSEPKPFTKNVVIVTDARPQPLVGVKVQGTARARYSVEPRVVSWVGSIDTDVSTLRTVVSLSPYDDPDVRLLGAETDQPWLAATLPEAAAGQSTGRSVVVAASWIPAIGTNRARVLLRTTSEDYPLVEVPVSLRVQGNYAAMPEAIYLGVQEPSAVSTTTIHVRKRLGARDFSIVDVSSDSPSVTVHSHSERSASEQTFDVQVSLPEDNGRLSATISVLLDSGGSIRIPVSGYVLRRTQ
jgi:hypothetical protein